MSSSNIWRSGRLLMHCQVGYTLFIVPSMLYFSNIQLSNVQDLRKCGYCDWIPHIWDHREGQCFMRTCHPSQMPMFHQNMSPTDLFLFGHKASLIARKVQMCMLYQHIETLCFNPFLGRRHISRTPQVKIGIFMDDKNSNSNSNSTCPITHLHCNT